MPGHDECCVAAARRGITFFPGGDAQPPIYPSPAYIRPPKVATPRRRNLMTRVIDRRAVLVLGALVALALGGLAGSSQAQPKPKPQAAAAVAAFTTGGCDT